MSETRMMRAIFRPQIRPRLGVGIGCQRLSAVLVYRGVIRWWTVQPRQPDRALGDELRQLLASYPPLGHFRPVVSVSVGATSVHVKRASRLPMLAKARDVARLVQENADRFFLHTFADVVTCARLETPGIAWIAAFDATVVTAVVSACQAKALGIAAVAPTVMMLAHASAHERAAWTDGHNGCVVSFEDGRTSCVRPTPDVDLAPATSLVPALRSVGEQAWEIADAYGATQVSPMDSLVLRPHRSLATPHRAPKRSLVTALVSLAAVTLFGLVLPPIRDAMTVRHAQRQLTALQHVATLALARADSLAAVTDELDAVADFTRDNRLTLLLLAEFTRALPDSVALLSLQIDSAGTGRLSAVAPRAAQVVDAVERVPDVASARIIGPVARRPVGTQQFQEVTMTFSVIDNQGLAR